VAKREFNPCIEFAASIAHPTWMRVLVALWFCFAVSAAETAKLPNDPGQILERTCFQTGSAYSDAADLRSDVAIVYGIDPKLPLRITTWHDKGYRVHVMTGVSWGRYQDYLYGRFDGINHEDEAQTDRNGNKISHGGDVYYMCPGTNYGKFLSVGIQRALDAGVEAIHLEEPEFWVRGGYEEGFKREWKAYFGEDWQPPHSSPDAQWRASKLKYFLYRRALQQVFDYVQDNNRARGRHVRCYVPTHSLINYAHWHIVSPESSLARVDGCDGYIAQVWTGTSRTPNVYRGVLKERTFETAFLEYGAMQNLVRSTGRGVWYLNDPIEDNPNHDWNDYQRNWESTLVASLFQPEVWQYEVAPWPERIFNGKYPRRSPDAKSIPSEYATELQIVFNALNDMKQERVEWDCGTTGIGVVVSDSLMFERGEPDASEPNMAHFYGLALPFLKRGIPITPVQLENVTVADYLKPFRVLLLSYHGQKPLAPDVHAALAKWVRSGGALIFIDDDSDPYNKVREWWNTGGMKFTTPRQHLFQEVGAANITWIKDHPGSMAYHADKEADLVSKVKARAKNWKETNYLLLRRGPYVIASGMDESIEAPAKMINGRFVNLFDSELKLQRQISVAPASRILLKDLDDPVTRKERVVASACKMIPTGENTFAVEGIANTQAVVLLRSDKKPAHISLAGKEISSFEFSEAEKLLWIKFPNESTPRELTIVY
jgi:hypothetical protein